MPKSILDYPYLTISKDKLIASFKTISNADARGNVSTWTIKVLLFDSSNNPVELKDEVWNDAIYQQPDYYATIVVDNIKHTGKRVDNKPTVVSSGKNLSKSNATNAFTQAVIQANSKFTVKLRQSEQADTSINKPMPMALKKYNDVKVDFTDGVFVQPKMDGIRCIAYLTDDAKVELYSRGMKVHAKVPHINEALSSLYIMQPDVYLDGELCFSDHKTPLQEVNSAVNSSSYDDGQKNKVVYKIYDCFNINISYNQDQRINYITGLSEFLKDIDCLEVVNTIRVNSEAELYETHSKFVEQGHEGTIVRLPKGKYKYGFNCSRSSDVLKVKDYEDSEFKIVDFGCGTKGKDVGAIIFVLETDSGKQFNAVPNMTINERRELYKTLSEDSFIFDIEYKDKMATIQYADLNRSGIPSQPKFIGIRDDL